nr:MAG TPA: hypothetical protein [Caudoviricetes sp.]
MRNGTGIIKDWRCKIMNKTQMAVIAGIVLAVIVGCIAGGVF